jgi:hypothetical protein
LQGIKDYFAGIDQTGIVFISDRDKGLQAAVAEAFSKSHHSYCCQHLGDNIQKHFGLACRTAFWKVAYAANTHDFDAAMDALKALSAPAQEYLAAIPKESWA